MIRFSNTIICKMNYPRKFLENKGEHLLVFYASLFRATPPEKVKGLPKNLSIIKGLEIKVCKAFFSASCNFRVLTKNRFKAVSST